MNTGIFSKRIILSVAALTFAGVACTSQTQDSTPRQTTGTENLDHPLFDGSNDTLASCTLEADQLADEITDWAESIDPSRLSESYVQTVIAQSRSILSRGNDMLDRCEQYAPAGAASARVSLDGLEDSTDSLENTAEQIYG